MCGRVTRPTHKHEHSSLLQCERSLACISHTYPCILPGAWYLVLPPGTSGIPRWRTALAKALWSRVPKRGSQAEQCPKRLQCPSAPPAATCPRSFTRGAWGCCSAASTTAGGNPTRRTRGARSWWSRVSSVARRRNIVRALSVAPVAGARADWGYFAARAPALQHRSGRAWQSRRSRASRCTA